MTDTSSGSLPCTDRMRSISLPQYTGWTIAVQWDLMFPGSYLEPHAQAPCSSNTVLASGQRSAASKARRLRPAESRTQLSAATVGYHSQTNGVTNVRMQQNPNEDWGDGPPPHDQPNGATPSPLQSKKLRGMFSDRLRIFAGTANSVSLAFLLTPSTVSCPFTGSLDSWTSLHSLPIDHLLLDMCSSSTADSVRLFALSNTRKHLLHVLFSFSPFQTRPAAFAFSKNGISAVLDLSIETTNMAADGCPSNHGCWLVPCLPLQRRTIWLIQTSCFRQPLASGFLKPTMCHGWPWQRLQGRRCK